MWLMIIGLGSMSETYEFLLELFVLPLHWLDGLGYYWVIWFSTLQTDLLFRFLAFFLWMSIDEVKDMPNLIADDDDDDDVDFNLYCLSVVWCPWDIFFAWIPNVQGYYLVPLLVSETTAISLIFCRMLG